MPAGNRFPSDVITIKGLHIPHEPVENGIIPMDYWNPHLETLPRERLRTTGLENFRQILRHAKKYSSFYREKFEGWSRWRRLGRCPGDTFQEAFRELKVKTKLRFNIDLVPPVHYRTSPMS